VAGGASEGPGADAVGVGEAGAEGDGPTVGERRAGVTVGVALSGPPGPLTGLHPDSSGKTINSSSRKTDGRFTGIRKKEIRGIHRSRCPSMGREKREIGASGGTECRQKHQFLLIPLSLRSGFKVTKAIARRAMTIHYVRQK